MAHPVLRYALHILALLVLGPIAYFLAMSLRDSVGSTAATIFHNATPMRAVLFVAYTLLAATAAGALGSRLFSAGTGMTAAGFVLAWAGWGLGTIDEIVRATNGRVGFALLGGEGFFCVALAGLITVICTRLGSLTPAGNLWSISMEPGGKPASAMDVTIAVVAAAVGAGVLAWFYASSDSHGQTLGAAFVGGGAAGVIAQLVLTNRKCHARPLTAVVGVGLVATIGPLIGQFTAGNNLLATDFAGRLSPIALPVGLTWAAGALIGVPLGLGWAGHAIDRRVAAETGLTPVVPD